MDKSAVLKARVTEKLHADFLAVCSDMGSTSAVELRRLIEGFVDANSNCLDDDVKVYVERPAGYDLGAWKARITLRDTTAMQWMNAPIPFTLPVLPKRRVAPDKGFAVASLYEQGRPSTLSGIFVTGVWEGHIYSNGVAEAENPTPIKDVADALRASVAERIAAFHVP